jgi:hypothetical protein
MNWTESRWPPKSRRPMIDMTVKGEFVDRPAAPLATRVLGIAILVAILAGAFAAAAVAFYVAIALIPVALVAGAIAYLAFRYQMWRARRASLRGPRDLSPR